MNREEIIDKLNELLIEEFEIEPDHLTPEASLKDDLEIDSLDLVDVVVLINDEFGFRPSTEEMKTLKTLNDFYDFIENSMNR